MTDRDYFAAAALSGILDKFDSDIHLAPACSAAYRWADAMLRACEAQTEVQPICNRPVAGSSPAAGCDDTTTEFHAAVMNWISEATSLLQYRSDGGRRILADACQECWSAFERTTSPPGSGVGGTPASAPERQSPVSDQGVGEPPDVGAPTRDNAAGGRGLFLSEAEFDALEYVSVVGHVAMHDRPHIASLLERLRPFAKRETDSPQAVASTPQTRATPSEGSVQIAGTLTDEEREAVEWFAGLRPNRPQGARTRLKSLLERLG